MANATTSSICNAGLTYHVLNRRVSRLSLFDKPADYLAFEKILREANDRTGLGIATSYLMPNSLAPIVMAKRPRRGEHWKDTGTRRLASPGVGEDFIGEFVLLADEANGHARIAGLLARSRNQRSFTKKEKAVTPYLSL